MLVFNIPMITDGVDYRSGHIDVVDGATTTREYSYFTYENHFIGLIMVVLGLFGSIYLVYEDYSMRRNRREES